MITRYSGPFKSRGILSLTSCFSCVACGDTRKTGKKSFCEDTSRSGKGPAAPCNPAFATFKSPCSIPANCCALAKDFSAQLFLSTTVPMGRPLPVGMIIWSTYGTCTLASGCTPFKGIQKGLSRLPSIPMGKSSPVVAGIRRSNYGICTAASCCAPSKHIQKQLILWPSVPMGRPSPVVVPMGRSRFGERNEQAVVSLLNEHVLLVSQKTHICIQWLAGRTLF